MTRTLTPAQYRENDRLSEEIRQKLEELINRTPTGEARNNLCDANIMLRMAQENAAEQPR